MLGTRYGPVGTRFSILGTRIGSLKHLKIPWFLHIVITLGLIPSLWVFAGGKSRATRCFREDLDGIEREKLNKKPNCRRSSLLTSLLSSLKFCVIVRGTGY